MLLSAFVGADELLDDPAMRVGPDTGIRFAPPVNVLIVDPEVAANHQWVQAFSERGWQVQLASSVLDALPLLQGQSFDVALIEMALPDMLGTEAWTFIQKMQPRISGIITTSSPSLHRSINALGEGAAAYLLKPLDARYICNLIEKLIQGQQLQDQFKRVRQQLAGLFNLFSTITSATSLDQILSKTISHLRACMHYDLAIVYHLSSDGTRIARRISHGSEPHLANLSLAQSEFIETLARRGVESLRSVVVDRSLDDSSEKRRLVELDLESCVIVPLIGKESIYGALAIINHTGRKREPESLRVEMLSALGQVVAMALDRAQLADKLNRLQEKHARNPRQASGTDTVYDAGSWCSESGL